MEIAANAAGGAITFVLTPVQRQIGYLFHFRRNANNLKSKVDKLKAARNDVQRLVEAALKNNELIREAVDTWLMMGEKVGDEATQLVDEVSQSDSWFKGWCTCSRFRHGRKIEQKVNDIQGLLDERGTFGDHVSDPKPIQSLGLISIGDSEVFPSRESKRKEVLEALKDDHLNIVAVHGMGGVGKTTLMKAVVDHVKMESMFDEVVMVTVSQNLNMKKIQNDVAKELDLELKDEDAISLRGRQLSHRFRHGKRVLVILDDLWEQLDLTELGIPLRNDLYRGCKVLLTTRNRDVCNQMDTQKTIDLKVLLERESWILFQEKAGEVVNSTDVQDIARDIVRKCEGLPLAIVTLGRALRNKEKPVWNDALQQLKKSIYDGLSPVFSSIKLSYNFLKNESTKLCFLFCCLFAEDTKIKLDVLLSYVMGERILQDVDSLEEARGRLHTVVNRLVSSCLLFDDEDGCIWMHDVVRDVAISIASEEDHGFLVKAGLRLAQWPDMRFDKCKRMSLMRSEIMCNLPNQIKASQLLTLSFRKAGNLKEIPCDFFQEKHSLLTLDMSGTSLTSLPSSLSLLVKLRTLRMKNCYALENVSPIEKLESLEILNLDGCKTCRVPDVIRRLTNLRWLSLWFTHWYESFEPDVISSLSQLEELVLEDGDGSTDILREIVSSTRLNALTLHIRNSERLSQIIPSHWENLKFFRIQVGGLHWRLSRYHGEFKMECRKHDKSLFLKFPSNPVADWVMELLERTNCLFLEYSVGFESIVVHLAPKGLHTNLKVLSVANCKELKYLMSTVRAEEAPVHAFNNLEKLYLTKLVSFESIFHGTALPQGFLNNLTMLRVDSCPKLIVLVPHYLLLWLQKLRSLTVESCKELDMLIQFEGEDKELSLIQNSPLCSSSKSDVHEISSGPESLVFPYLSYIKISNCNKLKCILPMRVVRQLLQLQELHISSCSKVDVIFAHDTEEKEETYHPRLVRLELSALPALSSFGPQGFLVRWPSLEYLKVEECENLRRLPLGVQSVPKLKNLVADDHWFNELEWEDESLRSRLQVLLPVIGSYDSSTSDA